MGPLVECPRRGTEVQNHIIEGFARAKTELRELERSSELQSNRRRFSFKSASLRNLLIRSKSLDRKTAIARQTARTA